MWVNFVYLIYMLYKKLESNIQNDEVGCCYIYHRSPRDPRETTFISGQGPRDVHSPSSAFDWCLRNLREATGFRVPTGAWRVPMTKQSSRGLFLRSSNWLRLFPINCSKTDVLKCLACLGKKQMMSPLTVRLISYRHRYPRPRPSQRLKAVEFPWQMSVSQ